MAAVVLTVIAVLSAAALSPARVARAGGPAGPNGLPPVDANYIYSLIDNTNVSTDLNDGKSWLVRYYSRLSGAAGNSQADNATLHPCLLDPTTGKNTQAALGNIVYLSNNVTTAAVPAVQDCWWEMMNAWRTEAAKLPTMSAANLTDHFYHLGEVDSNPYVSNPQNLSASQPGPQNTLMLTIPGALHPEQTVVIGEHQDGASLSTWGSAYDDGQGAAVIMGVARDMLTYWMTNHLWPARTVQFVLFDGEEEGLFGSFFYEANMMPIGAVDSNLYVGMFNVDQNGLEYPARHLGTPDKPDQGSWFTNINETPQGDYSFYDNSKYPRLNTNLSAIQAFHTETHNAVVNTFNELGQIYSGRPLPLFDYGVNAAGQYPNDCVTAATAQNPTTVNCVDTFQSYTNDGHYLLDKDDTLGRTDQDPFIRCGINAFGILGAYDSNDQEPVQGGGPLSGLPYAGYDTPVDNVGWLNLMASGKQPASQVYDASPPNEINPWNPISNPSGLIGAEAVRRALSFAGTLVLNEATDPQMAGSAATPTDPIAYFVPDRYTAHVGDVRTFNAIPSPVPATSWQWNFGDSFIASGPTATHAYGAPGVYKVSLTESAPSGTSTYTADVNVVPVGADANTVCGQVNNNKIYFTGNDTQFAPTFTNSVQPGTGIPETPWVPMLIVVACAVGSAEFVRRRQASVAGR